jgi:hypothetical protein
MTHEIKPLMFCSVKKHDTYHAPIKSKEELIFHVGFRQFVGRYGVSLNNHDIIDFFRKKSKSYGNILQANFL